MSSTSNAQDLLVNVFRPTYNWSSNTGFVPSLTVSNVSEVIAGTIKTDKLAVSDVRGNTYIGSNAGALLTNLTTRENTAIGYSAMAGAINSSNNVSIGTSNFSDITNGLSNVGIGAKTRITGTGQKNIMIGTNNTLGDGSENIIIGNDLSLGNISKTFRLGSLLYGDLSSGYIGINTSRPEAALDISGIVVFRNKVGFQNPNPIYSLDVAGSLYASEQIIGGKGTQSNPMYTFFDSSGSGMYIPVDPSYGTGAFAIAVNRAPAAIFSSNAVNFFQNLDVSGTFSARNIDISAFSVTNGTPSVPSVTFTNDTSTGLYLAASNRLGVTTGGFRRMEVLSNGDVSMGRLVTKDISYSGTIVGTNPNTCNVIGGVTLSNGNVILTGTATNSNLLVPGWIRNTDPATQFDISGGNISNSLTTRSSNFRASAGTAGAPAYSFTSDATTGLHSAGTSQLAFDTAGVQRMVISNGNVGIGKATPVVALEVVGDVSATTYNGPGGTQGAPHYTFSDDRTTGLFFPGANMIGLTAGGTERMRISNGNVGIGTTTPANALDVAGTLRVIGAAGDLTLSNGTISLAGVPVISSTGVLSNAASTSNSIGGVTLSNTNITYAGRISNSTDNTSNRIGGVTLSNASINYGGAITGATDSAVNRIGGVTLCNGQVVTTSYTSSSSFLASNGTAGNPAYQFADEQGIGVFRAGTAQLAFATGQSNRMVLSNSVLALGRTPVADTSLIFQTPTNAYISTGRVYLGDAPNSTPAYGATIIEGLSNGGSGACDLLLYSRPAGFGAGSDPLERMRIVGSTGRVGIGTKNPEASLDVSGGVVRVQRIYNGLANALVIADSTVAPIARWGVGILNAATGSGSGGNDFAINAYDDSVVASSPFMITRSNGNVGIGGGAASSVLDIRKADAKVRICDCNRQPSIELIRGDGTAAFGSSTIVDWRIQVAASGGLFQLVRGSTSGTITPFIVNPTTGNIGIGNAAWQAFPLDVSGIIQTNTGLFACRIEDTVNNAVVAQASSFQAEFSSYKRSETQRNDILFRTTNNAAAPVRMQILGGNGFVGVGARSPEGNLHLSSADSAANAANVLMMSTGSIKNGAYNEIQFRGLDGNGTVYLSAIQGVDTGAGASPYQGELRFLTTEAANQTYERMRIMHNGNIGIRRTNPLHALDVTGTIRGSSNIVAVTTSNWSVGTDTGYSDTTLSISYTPKQSGTVTLIVLAGADLRVNPAGNNTDGVYARVLSGTTEIAYFGTQWVNNPVDGRSGNNTFYGGNLATTAISGTTTIGLRFTRGGDDSTTYRSAYLTIMELSTT